MGYTFYVGPELEYFYFKKNDDDPNSCLRRSNSFEKKQLIPAIQQLILSYPEKEVEV